MTKKIFLFWTIFAIAVLSLHGCGGSDPAPVDLGDLINEPETPEGPEGPVVPPGELGDLIDLGDLVEPFGDHWYFTRAVAMNESGIVVGESNCDGIRTKCGFRWEPAAEAMTCLCCSLHPDCSFSEAIDINNSGRVIGNSTGCRLPMGSTKAFVWDNGICTDLHALGGFNSSYAEDVNDRGEVVLTASIPGEDKRPWYWPGSGSSFVPLCIIAGAEGGEAVAINENGHIIIDSGDTVVFEDLTLPLCESLNHLPGAAKTVAVDINDSQYANNDGIPDPHIIGNSGNGSLVLGEDPSVHGFFWDGGAMYPVDHLGGGTSEVRDMNNSDQVVGGATTADGSVHAFHWTLREDKRGIIRDLGTLGGRNSFATAINEAGQVVGYSETGYVYREEGIEPFTVWHAFLWDNGVMYDLGVHNDFYNYPFILPYPFSEGVDINDSGQVAGNSMTINSHYRGFYLSPVFP